MKAIGDLKVWDLLEKRWWSILVRYRAGWKPQRIADDLGVSVNTVYNARTRMGDLGIAISRLDAEVQTAGRCSVCDLVLPCVECLPDVARRVSRGEGNWIE